MRLTLATLGSRGDVQPMVVLAAELRARGHEVVLGVPPNLVAFAGAAGFEAHPLGPDSQAFVESEDGQRWLASGDVRAFLQAMADVGHEMATQADDELLVACQGADMIVSGVLGEDHALCVAEARGIPAASLHLAPSRPTRGYPNFLVTTRSRRAGAVNRVTGTLVEHVVWRKLRSDTNAFRVRLGLDPTSASTSERMRRMGVLELQGYSQWLAPRIGDYGQRRPMTGFLIPGAGLRCAWGECGADPLLDDWLSAGEPPVYFGFGSMPVTDPAATLAMIEAVAGRLGVRALVSAGWSGIATGGGSGDNVRIVGPTDHSAVLPRCRAAVHHGGAGTTAAGVAAGIPALVCSVFADQLFWGARLEELGCGAHRRFASLDARTLQAGVERILDPDVGRRAQSLGRALRAEADADPTGRACDHIERTYDEQRWTRPARRSVVVGAGVAASA